MSEILYVSNIELANVSGGMSGINNATYNQLKSKVGISDYLTINPAPDLGAKIKSKLFRLFGFKSNYHFFSERRLASIAKSFDGLNNSQNEVFFHGFTPWVKTRPKTNYYCYNDACFETYVTLYNDKSQFSKKDLKRIFEQEARWLDNAKTVFFQSNWALEETKRAYKISGSNFVKVGVGGYIDIPEKDYYTSGFEFLFISREFKPKGGEIAIKAFKIIKDKYPSAILNIVGDKPPENLLEENGINYVGFIDKNVKEEKEQLIGLFKKSFALLHPTRKDINPLIISELGYYGCPAISSNSFAIPEYVLDGTTGFLLNNETDLIELAEKMEFLIVNNDKYLIMRANSRKNAIENNTWDSVGDRISKII